ncbi:cyclic pyranopterin monophosphate synthase MoaC [archaeon]|nr:MAG: cyclic pyranopterin monophosphate synthase MoaC [archaeon]
MPLDISTKKGPVFATAIITGVQAAKRTSDLIPFCHSISLDSCKIDITLNSLENEKNDRHSHSVDIRCTVKCDGKTGVEMEALVGASHAALCVYDMLKAASHDMVIADIELVSKTGGKSDILRNP